MQKHALQALEFDRIVEVVRGLAQTPFGAHALAALAPLSDTRGVQSALTITGECVRFLETHPPLALQANAELDGALAALAIEGYPLEPAQLLSLADFLSSVSHARRAVSEAGQGPYPALRTIVEGCRSFQNEVDDIRSKIDATAGVRDQASPALKAMRERLRKQRQRLRSTLDSYLRGKDTARYLQERVITERDGRLVLVVRSEHRGAIPGIVHGSSGSGASLFLEPLSTVDINNDIVALEQDEAKEVRRILVALADAIRRRALDLRTTIDAATTLDVVQARATFSRLVDGVTPELSPDTRLDLRDARHPLLIPAVRRRLDGSVSETPATEPVAVDITITPPSTALVVTGPNTGGKTVALKTAGLLVLMAQAGLRIPAGAGSAITVFRSVFADIGDEQSIAASLSTFSGHITNLVTVERQLQLPALVLLDELGAGTDPTEGGALATAVIEHFRERGALVLVTTHDDGLKSYASTTAGVTCAGFGFDPHSFAPTYRLSYGAPGRSLALEIAGRLGMPSSIVKAARRRLGEREAQLAAHLAKVDEDLRRLERERRQLAERHDELETRQRQLSEAEQAVSAREERARQLLQSGVDARVRSARAEIDRVIEGLRAQASTWEKAAPGRAGSRGVRLSTGDTGALRAKSRASVEEVAGRVLDAAPEAPPGAGDDGPPPETQPSNPPRVGDMVRVTTLNVSGRVCSLQPTQAEVEVRGKRLQVPLGDLRPVGPGPGPAGATPPEPEGGGVTVHAETSDGPLPDLNVIGCTVDEACDRVEKYLDRALLQGQREVRIIHGHGTGRLRRSIAGWLEGHPQVHRFARAPREQGGDGATVVELKD